MTSKYKEGGIAVPDDGRSPSLASNSGQVGRVLEDPRELRGVATGFRGLDGMLGGLRSGELIVVAARSGVGKTTFALDIVRHAAIREGRRVLFFTFEMMVEDLNKRIIAAEAEVRFASLDNPKKAPYLVTSEWERIAKVLRRWIDSARVTWYAGTSDWDTRPETVGVACVEEMAKDPVDLVVVDNLQMIRTSRRAGSRQEEVAEISKALKQLAFELSIPVIAVSQLSRQSENRPDKRPYLSDLRGSGAIEQYADVVILLHRPDSYDKADRPGETDVMVVKNRFGAKGTIAIAARHEYSKHQDLAEVF